MTAAEIAAALGGAQRSGAWWRCRCPVHDSRGATLSLRDGEHGVIVKCWAGCDPCDVLAELRGRRLIDATEPRPSIQQHSAVRAVDDGSRVASARRLWKGAQNARGGPVARYLAGRGITVGPPASLRYAPRCWHAKAGCCLPAMVAAIVDVAGELIGVHRTYLRADGAGKADIEPVKAMLGHAAGGAVRLAEAEKTILVGEGIETCLAAMQATAQPAWAALSTSGMAALVLPPIVRHVVILADHDANGTGQRAAHAAGARWLAEGRRVRIAMPPEPGTDMADVLAGHAHARIEARDVAA